MSLLLEALQRADSERKNQGDVPGIDTEHSIAIKTESVASRHWILAALALIILVLLIYVVYLQLTGNKPSSSPAMVDPIATQSQAVQVKTEKTPTIENTAAVATSPTINKDSSTSSATQAEVAALYERLKAENASASSTRSSRPAEEVAASNTATNVEQRFDEQSEIRFEEIDQQNAAEEVYSSIPFASQLPDHQQGRIPSLRYTTHGYAEETGKGLVTLNGRTQRRGDTIAPGLVLLDIRADYIVLDMSGVLFRLPAATDWN